MNSALPPPIIYVDVDDTLVRSFGSKRIPMTARIERVRELYRRGASLYCWSTGGAIYAREVAIELGIEACFLAFLPKPQVLIDDVLLKDWRLLEVHPNVGASMELEALLCHRP